MAAEFMPVSLLTRIAHEVGATEGAAGDLHLGPNGDVAGAWDDLCIEADVVRWPQTMSAVG